MVNQPESKDTRRRQRRAYEQTAEGKVKAAAAAAQADEATTRSCWRKPSLLCALVLSDPCTRP